MYNTISRHGSTASPSPHYLAVARADKSTVHFILCGPRIKKFNHGIRVGFQPNPKVIKDFTNGILRAKLNAPPKTSAESREKQ